MRENSYLCAQKQSDTMTANRRHNFIKAISKKAKEITPDGSEVILFGSQARGDARPDSDWDVLILLDKDRVTSEDLDAFSYPLREMGWDYDECINPLLFTKRSGRRISPALSMKT